MDIMEKIESLEKIYNTKLFEVLVPKLSLYSPEEINTYGFNMTVKDGNLVRNNQMEITHCMLPLSKIVEIYNNGYSVSLPKKENLDEVYKILERYLEAKYDSRYRTINRSQNEDDEDLRGIDSFLNEMFGYNRTAIVKNIVTVKNGFDLGMDVMKPKQLTKSAPAEPIKTESRYGKLHNKLATTPQGVQMAFSPDIDFDSINRTSRFK